MLESDENKYCGERERAVRYNLITAESGGMISCAKPIIKLTLWSWRVKSNMDAGSVGMSQKKSDEKYSFQQRIFRFNRPTLL